jgi:hypothetical protein
MKYVVEGNSFDSQADARAYARGLGRPARIEWGDSTYGETPEHEWVNVPETIEPEPVDRTERLARRLEPVDGTPPVSKEQD